MSLLVTGTVAFDAIETPFGKTEKIIGGAATYVGLAASCFVKDTSLIAVVGDDFPKTYLDLLESKGINITGIQVKTGEKSFFWSGRYFNDMNSRETLITELNVLADFDPVVPAGLDTPDYLMLGNLAPSVQSALISRLAKRPKLIVMDTMNFWMDIALEDLKHTLSMVDVLTINDEEARQLSGEYSLIKASRKIRAMGPKYLIIKRENTVHFCSMKIRFSLRLPCCWKMYLTQQERVTRLQVVLLAGWPAQMILVSKT